MKGFNALRRITIARMQKKRRVKEVFADTGAADKMIDQIRDKRKPTIDPSQLPF